MNSPAKQTVLNGLATFPIVWLLLLYLFILRARFYFGHWPSASDRMAKYMGFSVHQSLIVYGALAAPWIAVGVAIAAVILRRRDPTFRVSEPLAILAVSVLVSVALLAIDPGRFVLWFMD
jgi:hypothetical protein